MSLILDALNRSQRERDSNNDVPSLETQHPVEPLSQPGAWRRWLPWVGLVVALCVIAWLALDRGNIITEPVIQDSPPADVIPPEREPEPEPVVTEAARPKPLPAAEIGTTIPAAGQEITRQASLADAAVEDLYKKRVENESAPEVEKSSPKVIEEAEPEREINIEEVIARAQVEVENAALTEHSAPFLSQLSQQTKNRIPTIYYSGHDYSAISSQSSVTLNGEQVRVGAKVAGVLKLEEILPDSIVLSHQGTQFRLRALNSWINL